MWLKQPHACKICRIVQTTTCGCRLEFVFFGYPSGPTFLFILQQLIHVDACFLYWEFFLIVNFKEQKHEYKLRLLYPWCWHQEIALYQYCILLLALKKCCWSWLDNSGWIEWNKRLGKRHQYLSLWRANMNVDAIMPMFTLLLTYLDVYIVANLSVNAEVHLKRRKRR